MTKVLLIQNTISSYRVPIYNKLAEKYELTVIYSYGEEPKEVKFKTELITVRRIGKLYIHNKNLSRIAEKFDVIIVLFSPFWLSISFLVSKKNKRSYSVIPWGIGVPASYLVRFDDKSKMTLPFEWMIDRADAIIFYSSYAREKYIEMGYNQDKLFVAPNTVVVLPSNFTTDNRDSLLFIGSMYKAKGIMSLLESYLALYQLREENIPSLYLIGSGPEYNEVFTWVNKNRMSNYIKLEGEIFDEFTIKNYFEKAIACISPGQAGLSVQKSMGYGVPFITNTDAFTGGERLDIINGETGILYKSDNDLLNILIDICDNPNKYYEIGKKAYDFYHTQRTSEQMVQGVVDAINYSSRKQINPHHNFL